MMACCIPSRSAVIWKISDGGSDGMAASRTAVLEKISRVPLVIYEAGDEYVSVSYTLWCFVEIN
jgi:hypothetical protein